MGGVEDGEEVDQGLDPLDPDDDVVSLPGKYTGGSCGCDAAAGGFPGALALAALLAPRRRRA